MWTHRTRPVRTAVLVAAGACFLFLGACAGSQTPPPRREHPVVAKAEFDMECPRAQLSFQRLNPDTIGVSGCGRRATYARVCRQSVRGAAMGVVRTDTHCQYVLEHMRESAGQPFQMPTESASATP